MNFIAPGACGQAFNGWQFIFIGLIRHLTESLWNLELEHALERFSIRIYLDWFEHHPINRWVTDEFPEKFLNYLKGKVSNPCG